MTLRACRINRGMQKKNNWLCRAQNKAVYADLTPTDLAARIRAGLLFILFSAFNWLTYFSCLLRRVGVLLPQWSHSLLNFCPHKESFISSQPLVIGHRGNPTKAVENTLEACQLAVSKLQAEAVEVDLCVTKDDQVILWHDWDANDIQAVVRQMGLEPKVRHRPYVPVDGRWLKRVSQLTLEEFRTHYNYSRKRRLYKSRGAHIPLLKEFFKWAITQSTLKAVFLDVKVPEREKEKAVVLVSEVARLAEQFTPSFRIILLTPEETVLAVMRQTASQFDYSLDVILPLILVLDPTDFSTAERARRLHNRFASVGRPTALDIAPWATYRQIIAHDRQQMQSGADFPQELFAWTINHRREMRCLIKMGVDGIITDRPAVLAKLLRSSRIGTFLKQKLRRKNSLSFNTIEND